MKLLVTGASGFIGRAFCEFASRAKHQVTALTRTPAAFDQSETTAIEYDFLKDTPSSLSLEGYDAVFHPAWISTPGEYWNSPLNAAFVEATLHFANALSAVPKPPQLCVAGTCAEYLPDKNPLSEEAPLNTNSRLSYIRSKLQLHERLAMSYPKLSWARIFYPYGPGEHSSRLVSSAIAAMKKGESFKLNAPHFQKDYIYIDDLCSAILSVIDKQLLGPVNIGSGEAVQLGALLQEATSHLSNQSEIETPNARDLPPLEITIADVGKLKATGWTPRTGITEGLKKLAHSLS